MLVINVKVLVINVKVLVINVKVLVINVKVLVINVKVLVINVKVLVSDTSTINFLATLNKSVIIIIIPTFDLLCGLQTPQLANCNSLPKDVYIMEYNYKH